MMILVMGNCLLDLFVVFDLDLEPIWVDNSCCFCLFFFVWQQLELNIIYFICFDNSMKKVIQCMCVDYCENIQSQDMYVKFPKIQSTYFVNRDIYCIYMKRVSIVPNMSLISGQPTSIDSMSSRTQFGFHCCKTLLHYIIKYNNWTGS
jgi:hypothetical protein